MNRVFPSHTDPADAPDTDELPDLPDLSPTALALSPADELTAAARQIRHWQMSRGWSDAALCAEFRGVGSDKTYKKLWNGNTSELDIARQLRNYRAVLAEIELLEESEATEPVYDNIGQVPAVLASLGRFIVQRGLRRFYLIEGPSGSGKTNLLNILCQRQPAKVLRLNGRQRWRSMVAFLRDVLALLPAIDRSEDKSQKHGRRDPAMHELMEEATRRLLATSRVLAIDEAQYLTGTALNFLKDCINQGVETGVRFYVLAAGQDTLWKKLESSAEEEAKQLRHNRLFLRVSLLPPSADDCRDFLERSITFEAGQDKAMERGFADVAKAAASLGHWSFVRDVRDDLRAIIKGRGETPTASVQQLREITDAVRMALGGG